ncbi:hypothetical protein [Pseudomonas rhizophila]|uniref:hypothetical protein n=1 Tax=Pseudomonas rhizophila TaxID=2045200 RepID=UPI0030DC3010
MGQSIKLDNHAGSLQTRQYLTFTLADEQSVGHRAATGHRWACTHRFHPGNDDERPGAPFYALFYAMRNGLAPLNEVGQFLLMSPWRLR